MQLDIFANETLLTSITEVVENQTRNETRYRLVIPAGTDSIKLLSVGGSTKKRACLQELYLLSWRKDAALPNIGDSQNNGNQAVKFIENGHLYIRRNNNVYDITGRKIR